jgi:glycosyltransferase involved in cell wall biosynthesis
MHLSRAVTDSSLIAELAGRLTIDHCRATVFSEPALDIGAANYKLYLDLIEIARNSFQGDDIIYVSMIHHRNMFGLMKLLDDLQLAGRMPFLSATIWTQECFDSAGRIHQRNSQFYRAFFSWLAANRSKTHGMFAFSDAHLDHINTLGAIEAGVEAQGHIMATMPVDLTSQPPQPGLWRFGYFGNASTEHKGLAKLLEAARLMLAQRSDVRFVIQIYLAEANYDHDGLRRMYEDVLTDPRVTLLDGNLTATQYFEKLARCDVVVLPYGPAYDQVESGILHEATHLGKPVVLPETSLANGRLRRASVQMATFTEWTGQAIAECCMKTIADYDRLASELRKAAPDINRDSEHATFANRCGVVPLMSASSALESR